LSRKDNPSSLSRWSRLKRVRKVLRWWNRQTKPRLSRRTTTKWSLTRGSSACPSKLKKTSRSPERRSTLNRRRANLWRLVRNTQKLRARMSKRA
jgi:hypothetical protein